MFSYDYFGVGVMFTRSKMFCRAAVSGSVPLLDTFFLSSRHLSCSLCDSRSALPKRPRWSWPCLRLPVERTALRWLTSLE